MVRGGPVSLISAELMYSIVGDSLRSIIGVEAFALLVGDTGLVGATDVEEDELRPAILPLVEIKCVIDVEWL